MNITPLQTTSILNSVTFLPLPKFNIDFVLNAKVYNQEGNMSYEYNPFRNIRDISTGQLKNFTTTDLSLSLNNPVIIDVQESYDGTVNLIINDDLNPPRIVNSRFSLLDNDRYQIVDRQGNTETNIYNEPFVKDLVRLYKTTQKIPYITFQGLSEGGALECGNYVFYFKYADADGNESDIVAESGIISCYIGKLNDPFSTKGGLANELTNKIAKMTLNNLDLSYDYVNVYFTRATSDINEQEIVEAYKIVTRKTVSGASLNITVTGLEDVQQIDVDDLNLQYSIVDSVKTQTQVQNLLFFGNVNKPTVPFKDLQDLALRIYPTISNNNNIGYMDQNYKPQAIVNDLSKSEYYDAVNVYKYTGYWNKEMYRVGVVFIMKDDTLSPVFNVRGRDQLAAFPRTGTFAEDIASYYTYTPLYDSDNNRLYINYDDKGLIKSSTFPIENSRGVVRIAYEDDMINKGSNTGIYPLSVNFSVEKDTLTEMKKFVKGFFFVRQKRIPTILCQGISIGVDNISFIPSLKAQVYQNSSSPTIGYVAESFVDKSIQLVHDFSSRMLLNTNNTTLPGGFIVPEAQLKPAYFSEIFTGALFNCSKAPFSSTNHYFTQDILSQRHFYIDSYVNNGAETYLYQDVKLTAIEDNQPMRYSGTKRFSTRVGIPEQAWDFSWFGTEDRSATATNLIRGAYSGFVGAENFAEESMTVDIHIPGYDLANMSDYFQLRGDSFHPFYAISDRYDLELLTSTAPPYENITTQSDNIRLEEYRGDCFIGTYTTRIVRNFQDPDTPINDTIIDSLTWQTNYKGYTASGGIDATAVAKINRGDVNAVEIGHWATFKVCSNINLAYRATDSSNTSEYALTGKARSFFPLSSMSATGESKIPDSAVVNVGYNATTSSKVYITLPNVPFIKNAFNNRLMFSEPNINDAFRNGYRVFKLDAYKDLTHAYGSITRILEWNNNLMIVFDDGVAMVPVNEKMIGASGNGGNAYLNSGQVLPDIVNPLSTNFGSHWRDSVIQTPTYVYGVDATAKKIWRTNGRDFEIISDFKVQKFLNDNLTLKESDVTPLTALRNIKTHYNAFKQDVIFTFYDNDANNKETIWSLCYNEQLQTWITRFSWVPLQSEDIANVWFSFDRQAGRALAMVGYSLASSPEAQGIVISAATVNSTSASLVGILSLKGYNYYSQFIQTFTLDSGYDSAHFSIVNNAGTYELHYNGGAFTQYSFMVSVRVGLSVVDGESTTEVQFFHDFIGMVVNRANLDDPGKTLYDDAISNWFWKHGQAGIFDTQTVIEPTLWYGKQEVFEFEFIVVDNPTFLKDFDNLKIVANDAEPDSFEFTVVGDSYNIDKTAGGTYADSNGWYTSTYNTKGVHTYQKALPMPTYGRRQGNIQYKEDLWDVEIRPFRNLKGTSPHQVLKEARIRDKYVKIRVRYSGTQLALITALITTYTRSYA